MAKRIDQMHIGHGQRIEFYDDGTVLIVRDWGGKVELDAEASATMLDLLDRHRAHIQARAAEIANERMRKAAGAGILERATAIIAKVLSIPESAVVPEADLVDNLRAGSIELVGIILGLEEEFGVYISDKDADRLNTAQDIQAFLEEKIGPA